MSLQKNAIVFLLGGSETYFVFSVWLVNTHLHTISIFFSFRTGHFCEIRFSSHRLQVRFSSSLTMYGNIHKCTHIALVSDMMFLWDSWWISTFSMRHHANCSLLCQLTCIYSPIIKYHETTQTFEYTKSNPLNYILMEKVHLLCFYDCKTIWDHRVWTS